MKIKFRGKSIRTKEWVYGYYWTNENGNHFIRQTVDLDGCFTISDIEVIPGTVGQFTGLYDKCGKEIYKGDILEVGQIRKKVVVTFKDGDFGFLYENICINPKHQNPKIIGNIYDNEDLLEEVQNV